MNSAIVLWIIHGILDVNVSGINVLQELITMLSLLDDKGVIHIPKPKPRWIGDSTDGFGFYLMNNLTLRGLMGGSMAAPWTCSEYLPWKRKYM